VSKTRENILLLPGACIRFMRLHSSLLCEYLKGMRNIHTRINENQIRWYKIVSAVHAAIKRRGIAKKPHIIFADNPAAKYLSREFANADPLIYDLYAITEISTRTFFGNSLTATVSRAGGFSVKYSPYIALT